MVKLTYFAESFIGRRKNNQDACTVIDLGNECYLLAVADGMGGTVGGQIASNLVLDYCRESLENEFKSEIKPEYNLFAFPFTDYKVKVDFFDKIYAVKELNLHLSFGCAGVKDDIPFNLQRIPMEDFDFPAKKALRREYCSYLMKKLIGKNNIKR